MDRHKILILNANPELLRLLARLVKAGGMAGTAARPSPDGGAGHRARPAGFRDLDSLLPAHGFTVGAIQGRA